MLRLSVDIQELEAPLIQDVRNIENRDSGMMFQSEKSLDEKDDEAD